MERFKSPCNHVIIVVGIEMYYFEDKLRTWWAPCTKSLCVKRRKCRLLLKYVIRYAQLHAFSYVVSSFSRFASVDKLIGEGGVLSRFGPATTRYSTPASLSQI